MSLVARALAFALVATAAVIVAGFVATPAFAATGSRPAYIYDRANIITPEYRQLIDTYLRGLDDATTNEIVIYTIPSFVGHGIKKDGIEIQDRDMLANYIYNELTLDGIKGIGKAGKDNGVLVLLSLQPDAAGGSMRIEVGRGLEGDITDGTAGEILDKYLVPARQEYVNTGSTEAFSRAFYNTVIALGARTGYQSGDSVSVPTDNNSQPSADDNNTQIIFFVLFFAAVIGIAALNSKYGRGRRRGGYIGGGYGGWGGGWGGGGGGGGGFGGGGGRSGGGGAGR